ncbi:MAG TPA: ABC transporter permease [Bryobacteraceae bacterium]|nr:ABC transporter permease [Bryobacteraceae bacterium]
MPESCRDEWLARWDTNLTAWRILCDRGEVPGPDSRGAVLLNLYRKCIRDALTLRLRTDAAQALLHGPLFVLGIGTAILILLAASTHGFRGVRSFFEGPPIEDAAGLVSAQYPARPNQRAAVLARLIPLWRSNSAFARDIAGYRFWYNQPRAWVTWNFFAVLGTRPAAGRLFQPGDRNAVVLSYPAWRSLYRANPRVIGSAIQVDGRPYTVVGVLPELFWALSPSVDFWLPLNSDAPSNPPGFLSAAVARLAPGAANWQLAKELTDLAKAAIPGPPRVVRIGSFANRLPGRDSYWYLIGTLFSIISGLVMVVKEHRRPTGHNWRYWPFLTAKTALAIAIPLLLWMEAGAFFRTFQPALGVAATIGRIVAALGFLVICVRGLWWCFADQRRRCPVCLRRLAIPVTLGSPASIFEPVLTELICPKGHGALSLPENETDRPDRWIALDSSWDELFKNK